MFSYRRPWFATLAVEGAMAVERAFLGGQKTAAGR